MEQNDLPQLSFLVILLFSLDMLQYSWM